MQNIETNNVSTDTVSYEEAPIAEIEVEGIEYRVDVGQGSAVALSCRDAGTWTWAPLAEGRWDGSRLRAKGLGFEVVNALSQALLRATRDQGE